MLESSVRALENHVILASVANSGSRTDDLFSVWHEPILSPVSSSFSSAVSITAATTPTGDKRLSSSSGIFVYGERSLPRRHHTIGNIRYDSSAYKTVSFLDDEPKAAGAAAAAAGGSVDQRGGAGFFRHMKQKDQEDEQDCSSNVDVSVKEDDARPEVAETDRDRNPSSSSEQQKRLNDEEEKDKLCNLVENGPKKVSGIISISRSKSFSDVRKEAESWRMMTSSPKRTEESSLRSKSFKDISMKPPSKSNRFSWDVDAMPLGPASSLRDFPSHLRSSLASLTSLDLHSGAPVSLDVPARDLASKPGVLSGPMEIKSKSGFKTFKKYWCALDGPHFYIYSRDKDPKAKQAIHLSGYKVKAVKVVESGTGLGNSFRTETKKKGRQFELTPPTGSKDSRQFAAVTKEEAVVWVQRIQEAIDNLAAEASLALAEDQAAEFDEKFSAPVPFWRQSQFKAIEYMKPEESELREDEWNLVR